MPMSLLFRKLVAVLSSGYMIHSLRYELAFVEEI